MNTTFADAVADQAADDSLIWFQDYHLALAPRRVRSQVSENQFLMQFWHIPWPTWDTFRVCPHYDTLLNGLLANDLLGFHTERDCAQFLSCAAAGLDDATVDWPRSRIHYDGQWAVVRAFPMGVDASQITRLSGSPDARTFWQRFTNDHGIASDTAIVLGVDRLDYTKGIIERLDALEYFWETHPEWREQMTYIQKASESRSKIPAYQAVQEEVTTAIERINRRFGTADWQPIIYTDDMLSRAAMAGLYHQSDVALVSSLRDGMNLVAKEYDDARAANIESDGIETTVFRFIRHYNPFAALVAVGVVARYLSREDIHVLHTHSTEAGIIGRLAARITGTPIVIHEIHGDPITPDRSKALNTMIRGLERLCATMATRLVVKSERILDCYLARGIGRTDKYEVIYHGVEIDKFRNATRASDLENEVTTLLFVGRLEEGKGLFDLIDAFEPLAERYSVELLIAGDGSLAEPLRNEIATRGLEEQIRLLGYRTDILAVMKSSDVFVLPSYREGTPRVITEALSAGLPVISTNIAGIPDQVDHGRSGYLVAPGDVHVLREQIATLLSDSDLRMEMGEHASEDVQMFDVKSKKYEYKELYRELLSEIRR